MKKNLTKRLSMILVLVMVMCLVPPVEAEAASKKPNFPGGIDFHYYAKDKSLNTEQWVLGKKGTNYKVTGLTSSNKKIVTVSKIYDQEYTCIKFKVKKAGKAKVSFKVKVGSKTYSYKCDVSVSKYSNPVKTLKIGTKNYASKYNKNNYYDLGGENKVTGKLTVKTNKDWEIKFLYIWDYNKNKEIKVKNNKNITLKENQSLMVSCYNNKTKVWTGITVNNFKW